MKSANRLEAALKRGADELMNRAEYALRDKPRMNDAPRCKTEQVDGVMLLDGVAGFIRRFVALSESQARAVALWVVHTHAFDAAETTPYQAVTSAEKESGKSRLLEVVETLVAKPWKTERVSAAVLIRKVDEERPTLLLDETDAAFGSGREYAEALRGVLNSGYRRGGKTSCCVGQGANISPKDFYTFCPKMIAGIGKLPDTVASRSIPIRLKRKAGDERVERFRQRDPKRKAEAEELQRHIREWTELNLEKLRGAYPGIPEELSDRQQDCAEPLLAIADAAGGEWPQVARRSLIELCARAQAEDDSVGVRLLSDIKQIFQARGVDRIPSSELAGALAEIETSPWGEWSHGKPLTAPTLARLLRPHDISPECIRIGVKTPRGYLREQFRDAFWRYLRTENSPSPSCSSSQCATPQQPSVYAGSGDFSQCNTESDVAVQECEKPNGNAACCTVAPSNVPMQAGAGGIEEEL
jgi:hypothetical protein